MKKANYIAGGLLLFFSAVILLACIKAAKGSADIAEIVLFPIILSGLIIVGSVAMILFTKFGPDLGEIQFHGKLKEIVIAMAIMLMAYPLLKYFGFIITTVILCYAMLRLLGNSIKTSVIAAILISVSIYAIFHYALSVSLPKGLLLRKIL